MAGNHTWTGKKTVYGSVKDSTSNISFQDSIIVLDDNRILFENDTLTYKEFDKTNKVLQYAYTIDNGVYSSVITETLSYYYNDNKILFYGNYNYKGHGTIIDIHSP